MEYIDKSEYNITLNFALNRFSNPMITLVFKFKMITPLSYPEIDDLSVTFVIHNIIKIKYLQNIFNSVYILK